MRLAKYSSSASHSSSSAAVRFPNLIFRLTSLFVDVKHDVTIASISFLISSLLFIDSVSMIIGLIEIFTDVGLDFLIGINSLSLSQFDSLELDNCFERIGLKKFN